MLSDTGLTCLYAVLLSLVDIGLHANSKHFSITLSCSQLSSTWSTTVTSKHDDSGTDTNAHVLLLPVLFRILDYH